MEWLHRVGAKRSESHVASNLVSQFWAIDCGIMREKTDAAKVNVFTKRRWVTCNCVRNS